MSFLVHFQIGFAQVSKVFEAQRLMPAGVYLDLCTYLAQDKLPPNWRHASLIASSRA